MNGSLEEKNVVHDPSSSPERRTHTTNQSSRSSLRELLAYIAVAGSIAILIRVFIASPWLVSGPSMLPNFHDFDYLIVDRLSYRFEEPHRGDVIVFGLPQMPSRDLIKRVIGLPGETVVIEGNEVIITNDTHPEGFTLDEPYLDPANLGGVSRLHVKLGMDEYFVLGDNRRVSADSRVWGVLPRKDIIGKVFLRLFPFTDIGLRPAQSRYTQDTTIQ